MSGLLKLKQVADYVQNYYPETLNRLFVVNAPSAFLVMWKIVKPWLNLKVRKRLHDGFQTPPTWLTFSALSKFRHWTRYRYWERTTKQNC
jgi:hypothetical protein